MQLPDREKLYLRCYRASGRTNSLFNFFWRFYVPSPDEVPEEEFVPIEDLLYIRYSEEVIVKQNKFYSGNLSLNSTAASDSQRNEEDGNGETGTSDGVGSSTPRTESSKPVAGMRSPTFISCILIVFCVLRWFLCCRRGPCAGERYQ